MKAELKAEVKAKMEAEIKQEAEDLRLKATAQATAQAIHAKAVVTAAAKAPSVPARALPSVPKAETPVDAVPERPIGQPADLIRRTTDPASGSADVAGRKLSPAGGVPPTHPRLNKGVLPMAAQPSSTRIYPSSSPRGPKVETSSSSLQFPYGSILTDTTAKKRQLSSPKAASSISPVGTQPTLAVGGVPPKVPAFKPVSGSASVGSQPMGPSASRATLQRDRTPRRQAESTTPR